MLRLLLLLLYSCLAASMPFAVRRFGRATFLLGAAAPAATPGWAGFTSGRS